MSGFDLDRFNSASLAPREERVPVPDLAHFFAGEAVWVVRGLTGEELARSNDATARGRAVSVAVEALASAAAAKSTQVEAMRSLLGHGEDVPVDLAKRFDHLVFGSVAPVIDRATAVRLAATFPVPFYALTNKILELTGLGPDLGKSQISGETPESEPLSPSAT